MTLNEDELRAACEQFVAAINEGQARIVAAFTQFGLLGLGADGPPYRPATYFADEYWQHRCGVASYHDPEWVKEGLLDCEPCDSRSGLGEWRRLYVRDEAGS